MATKVLLGFGGNVDVEIAWDSATVSRLAEEHAITQAELDPDAEIRDERDLVISILGFLQDGTGGERFADAAALRSLPERFRRRNTLGGTGLRAALTMDADIVHARRRTSF